jgi:cytochrome c biogenesis protein CcmG/thiol:disulfide interchange protein DsbE
VTAVRLVALALLSALVVGCTGSSSDDTFPAPSFSPNPKHSQLVAAAQLDRCPPSESSSVSGGLPDVTLPCLGAGPAVHLSGLVGKPLVVNVWATWCGPCKAETRYLSSTYDELKGQVRFLGVDTEEASHESALAFAPHVRPPMRYPSVIDDDKKVLLGLHGPVAVPSTVFVAADGKVVHQTSAPYRSVAALQADISHYLGVTASVTG